MLKVRFKSDNAIEAGVDEAGRGCLWGPLYAAAVIWPPESEWTDEHREIAPQIKDSKKITPKKRAMLAEAIKALAIDFGIGIVTALEIDNGGMSYANRLAFTRALDALTVPPDRVLLDGCLPLWPNQLSDRSIEEQETVVDGDALYLPIAAASILAKESRDAAVLEAVSQEPKLEEYFSIGSSKGYGTEKHRRGILEYGTHPLHRHLFLRKMTGKTETEDDACLIVDE